MKDGFDEAMGDEAGHFTWCQWIINDLSVSRAREQLETQIMSYPDLRAVFTLGTESVITCLLYTSFWLSTASREWEST